MDLSNSKNLKEHVIKTTPEYKGSIINVDREAVRIPTGEKAERDVVHHAKGVGALVITNNNKIVLEKQWREPVRQVTIEIPAGKVDSRDHGNSDHAMLRELNEEVRIKPKNFKHLAGFYTSPGFTDEFMDLYWASDLKKVNTKLPRDPGEYLNLFSVSLNTALDMIKKGKIRDGKSVAAIWYWKMLSNKFV